jgi:uncharacterized protein
LATEGLKDFEDAAGGFFSTREGASDILLRMKEDYDGAEPSANSIAIDVLLRLAHWTGKNDLYERAERALSYFATRVQSQPTTAPQFLASLGRYLTPPEQTIIRCQEAAPNDGKIARAANEIRKEFRPYSAVLVITDHQSKELEELAPALASLDRKGEATLYRCKNLTCDLPEQLA